MTPDDRDACAVEEQLFRKRCLRDIGHQGLLTRIFVAWLLTAIGLAGISTGLALVLFGPAAVLLLFAGMNPRSRRAVVLCSLPTALGLGLSVASLSGATSGRGLPVIVGLTLATTLLAALAGSPKPHP